MNKSSIKPYTILMIIGVLLLFISYLVFQKTEAGEDLNNYYWDVIKDTAVVILTIIIVNYLWTTLGGEPLDNSLQKLSNSVANLDNSVKLLEDSKETGLIRAFGVSGSYGSHTNWMQRFTNTKTNLDIMGYTLAVWTKGNNFENEVVNLAKKGVKIRVMTMDINNQNLYSIINTKHIPSISNEEVLESLKTTLNLFYKIQKRLSNENLAEYFQIKTLKEGIILSQLCRTDDELTIIPYLYTDIGARSPLFLVKGEQTELFKVYLQEFDKLWYD